MRLSCQIESSLVRKYPDDYVREIIVDVTEYAEGFVAEYLVGRFELKQVLWSEAIERGRSLFVICDEDSADLLAIYRSLMNKNGEPKGKMGRQQPFSYLLTVERVVLHPDIAEHAQHLLANVIGLFCEYTLTVTWSYVPLLTEKQLAELGFRKVAQTYLVFRYSVLRNDYEERANKWPEPMLEATEEHEDWVLREWEKAPNWDVPEPPEPQE